MAYTGLHSLCVNWCSHCLVAYKQLKIIMRQWATVQILQGRVQLYANEQWNNSKSHCKFQTVYKNLLSCYCSVSDNWRQQGMPNWTNIPVMNGKKWYGICKESFQTQTVPEEPQQTWLIAAVWCIQYENSSTIFAFSHSLNH